MAYIYTLATLVLSVVASASSLYLNGTLPDIAALCPLTTMCKSKPTKSDLTSCCQKCSCAEDCHTVGNCCPDKFPNNFSEPTYPCIEITQLFNEDRGLEFHPRYTNLWFHVIKTCPNQQQESLYPGCNSPVDIEDFAIVSDLAGEKVFKNRQCAMCHGVKETEVWKTFISDRMITFLAFETLEDRDRYILQNSPLISVPPNNSFVELSRCYPRTQMIDTCTADDVRDELKEACETERPLHNTGFVEPLNNGPFENRYMNIYCYLCSRWAPNAITNECSLSETITLKFLFGKQFSALLKPNVNDKKIPKDNKCGLTDIWDPFDGRCRPLLCQGGTVPFYGTCKDTVTQIDGYAIAIMFEIKATDMNWVTPLFFNFVTRKLYRVGRRRIPCGECSIISYRSTDSSKFFLEWELHANASCSVRQLLAFADKLSREGEIEIQIIDKQQRLVNITLQLTFDNETNLHKIGGHTENICAAVMRIDNIILRNCPRIELSPEETSCLIRKSTDGQNKYGHILIVDKLTNQTSICVGDYVKLRKLSENGQNTVSINITVWLSVIWATTLIIHVVPF